MSAPSGPSDPLPLPPSSREPGKGRPKCPPTCCVFRNSAFCSARTGSSWRSPPTYFLTIRLFACKNPDTARKRLWGLIHRVPAWSETQAGQPASNITQIRQTLPLAPNRSAPGMAMTVRLMLWALGKRAYSIGTTPFRGLAAGRFFKKTTPAAKRWIP